ncbi:MAG: FMN-binding negative transcriptional regulator [Pseudomonadota bacterium]
MHPNPAFRKADEARNLAFAQARGFGVLTLADPEGGFPLAAHVPFLIAEDGAEAEMHLVRSNPVARALRDGPLKALLAVSGPDGYISPDWYGDPGQVPTWNYVAVHLRGTLRLLPHAELRAHLARLSARFESELAPKKPWTMDKMTEEAIVRMERGIVPARFEVARIDGTWKLNQNKPEEARLGAAGNVPGSLGADLPTLSALMKDPPA